MESIKLLDCTLRDGGYVNDWNFGESVIHNIIKKLIDSKVSIIECGYIKNSNRNFKDYSLYHSIEEVKEEIYYKYPETIFSVMINYGEYPIEKIPNSLKKDNLIIRLAFHKKDCKKALEYCDKLLQKGFIVYLQPMVTINYSDKELLQLIESINKLLPSAFYIVDSFGVIELEEFKHLLSLVNHNLDSKISLGYHSHNNKQQAYENAKFMVEQYLHREIIIDASVFGMGRGAGNLNIELFAEYLNKNKETCYSIERFLEIIDNYLNPIFYKHYWGYSLPFYLSACHNCHPNYAVYLSEKGKLTIKSINEILKSISEDKKNTFSLKFANKLYEQYQENYISDETVLSNLKQMFKNRNILVLAPGKTLITHYNNIQNFISQYNPIIISIQFSNNKYYSTDICFYTNEKRFILNSNKTFLVTSNIKVSSPNIMKINYSSYLCHEPFIMDNAGIVFFNLLITLGIKKVHIAGFDGYSLNSNENYMNKSLTMGSNEQTKLKKNKLIIKQLETYHNKLEINFITPSLYKK